MLAAHGRKIDPREMHGALAGTFMQGGDVKAAAIHLPFVSKNKGAALDIMKAGTAAGAPAPVATQQAKVRAAPQLDASLKNGPTYS